MYSVSKIFTLRGECGAERRELECDQHDAEGRQSSDGGEARSETT